MRITKILQFLLLGLIIIGVFASMAKNSYGFTLMGFAFFGIALLYLLQFTGKLVRELTGAEKPDVSGIVELFLLAALLMLLGLRTLYIYLSWGEFAFAMVCVMLLLVYGAIAYSNFSGTRTESPGLARRIAFFHAAILLFILALITRVMVPWSLALGALGVLISLPFLISVFSRQPFELAGREITLFQYVVTSKNKAGLLFLFFIFSALYAGLSFFQVIPALEDKGKPVAYIELIRDAESGKEKPANGKFRHERYKEAMDKFLERHGK